MSDAQNERTRSQGRRRGKRPKRGESNRAQAVEHIQQTQHIPEKPTEVHHSPEPVVAKFVRPQDITPPTERVDIYCTHHMAVLPEKEPVTFRSNADMTTVRHLPVDHFGEATLFCDCLHNGPHEWPPMLQRIETAIELDQFRTDSTNDA